MSQETCEPDGSTDDSVATSLEISQHLLEAALPSEPMISEFKADVPKLEQSPAIEIPKPHYNAPRRSSKRRSSAMHKANPLRFLSFLPSRKLRVVLTCAGVLLVLGLVGLNFRNRSSSDTMSNEFLDIELSDFGDRLQAPNQISPSEVPVADNTPSNGFVEQASSDGPRGAWLTGQIEFDSPPIIPASASRTLSANRTPNAVSSARWSRVSP